jgi:serine protease Do
MMRFAILDGMANPTPRFPFSYPPVAIAVLIPINSPSMSDLIEQGYVTRSWLGVIIQDLDSETADALDINTRNGALIADVVKDSPAEAAGIQEGDVIVEFNGRSINIAFVNKI